MKKLNCLLTIFVAATLGLSMSAQARGYGHVGGYGTDTEQPRFERRVDRRQARQWDRVRNGLESGELSRREGKRLIRNQKKIARMERRFERDGYYSPHEKRKMDRALDRASKRIRRLNEHDYPMRGHRHGWRRRHHAQSEDPYAYESLDDSYVSSNSSSASISAQTDGFSIGWNKSRTY